MCSIIGSSDGFNQTLLFARLCNLYWVAEQTILQNSKRNNFRAGTKERPCGCSLWKSLSLFLNRAGDGLSQRGPRPPCSLKGAALIQYRHTVPMVLVADLGRRSAWSVVGTRSLPQVPQRYGGGHEDCLNKQGGFWSNSSTAPTRSGLTHEESETNEKQRMKAYDLWKYCDHATTPRAAIDKAEIDKMASPPIVKEQVDVA